MPKQFLILLVLLPFTVIAQYSISGKILNATDKSPVADASVFLNNSAVGAKSGADGRFTFSGVRQGQYDLIVSVVGYETFHLPVIVNGNVIVPDILVSPKTILLKEVRVGPDPDRARNYETFKRLFLGSSEFAADCKILNPDLVDVNYDRATRILSASTDDFLEIENKALGYKIKYLLKDFTNDASKGVQYFEGSAMFEDLKGSERQQRQWKKNRLKAYEGSSMNFLRSVISGTVYKDGFKVLRLIRKPNPDYHGGAGPKYKETLVANPPLTVNDFAKLTDLKGEFALNFNDCLYVMYSEKMAKSGKGEDTTKQKTPDYLAYPVTTTIVFDGPYAFFDNNGIIINPRSVIFDGEWGESGVAKLLPVDYMP